MSVSFDSDIVKEIDSKTTFHTYMIVDTMTGKPYSSLRESDPEKELNLEINSSTLTNINPPTTLGDCK